MIILYWIFIAMFWLIVLAAVDMILGEIIIFFKELSSPKKINK